jgi:hypothetical protein
MKVEDGATNAAEGKHSCRDGGMNEVSAVALAPGIATAYERTREGLQ